MESTNFLLHPGERVRSPRILAYYWAGDPLDANPPFRRLIYDHYVPLLRESKPQPIPFCNTCFTRGGGWLNECNAANQISLIRALAPLNLEAVITDAGWFEGKWPNGVGNWRPRREAYPDGMAPVAKAAGESGMAYGLWFEPERVSTGTLIHRYHPEWLLSITGKEDNHLLDFGLEEVREYMFAIISHFMGLPGFRVYRQDFNLDPLEYWQHNDSPDRQGITEMKYMEGLYAFWDRIAMEYPDSLREGCASGGRRIDLETISRFHIHQKTDYWFHNEVDQVSIWGLSQYIPNNAIVAHLDRLDDDSFNSTMASSLCVGWRADDPEFDMERARDLIERYNELKHLAIGSWYPLTGYTKSPEEWLVFQFHREDLDEGMVLAFRRESRMGNLTVSLRGIRPDGTYAVHYSGSGERVTKSGCDLNALEIEMPPGTRTELVHYRSTDHRKHT